MDITLGSKDQEFILRPADRLERIEGHGKRKGSTKIRVEEPIGSETKNNLLAGCNIILG